MSFQGKENFEYAKYIYDEAIRFSPAERHLSQAAYRTVVNRSYYGAFIQSRDFLNIVNTGLSVHADVVTALQSRDKQKGNNLFSLLKLRKDADYKTHLTLSAKETKEAIRLASKILIYIDDKMPK